MPPIYYIPDLETDVDPIPIDPSDIWLNDIRLDNYLKDRITHIEIIDLSSVINGSSSSSSSGAIFATYYEEEFYHPIASIELVEPEEIFAIDHSRVIYVDLPGRIGGPVMTDCNYLTYPGANQDIPGCDEDSSSSS